MPGAPADSASDGEEPSVANTPACSLCSPHNAVSTESRGGAEPAAKRRRCDTADESPATARALPGSSAVPCGADDASPLQLLCDEPATAALVSPDGFQPLARVQRQPRSRRSAAAATAAVGSTAQQPLQASLAAGAAAPPNDGRTVPSPSFSADAAATPMPKAPLTAGSCAVPEEAAVGRLPAAGATAAVERRHWLHRLAAIFKLESHATVAFARHLWARSCPALAAHVTASTAAASAAAGGAAIRVCAALPSSADAAAADSAVSSVRAKHVADGHGAAASGGTAAAAAAAADPWFDVLGFGVCLWIAAKLDSRRLEPPRARQLAQALGVAGDEILAYELVIMDALEWRPYAHWPHAFGDAAAASEAAA